MSGIVGRVSHRHTGPVGKYPVGTIIQTVQTTKTAIASTATTSEYIVPGFNVSITPKQGNSNILLQWKFDRGATTSITAKAFIERLIEGGSYAKLDGCMGDSGQGGAPAISHAGGEHAWMTQGESGMYIDDPAYVIGNEITYRVGVHNESSTATVYVGTTSRNNTTYHPNTAAIIQALEISA